MLNLPEKIVVFDSEWITWEGTLARWWTGPGEERRLTQIGAVLIETDHFTELSNFNVLIHPERPLSDYYVKLTGTTPEEIKEKGVPFLTASQMFYEFCADYPIFSWSRTDLEVLAENCRLWKVTLPIDQRRFFDVRMVFWKGGIDAENYNSGTIVKAFGKELSRDDHYALNDARTIVDGLKELSKIKG